MTAEWPGVTMNERAMTVRRRNYRLLVLMLALTATVTAAQDPVDEDDVEVRRYSVEMIIFSYAQDVGTGSEVFVPDRLQADEMEGGLLGANVFTDEPDVAQQDAKASPRSKRPIDMVRLPRDEFTLGKIYDELRRLDAYKPLMHFGWTQRTLPEDESEARPLSSFATPPRGLDGDLTLYLSRFLHLNVELKLDAPGAAGQSYNGEYSEPLRYLIAENRILRNGELRYFDHPKFGALAKIVRVEEEDDPLDEPELFGFDGE